MTITTITTMRTATIKRILLFILPFALFGEIKEPTPICEHEESHSPMQQREMMTREKLDSKERAVYDQLGPIYQKIFLFALNDEERHRVAIYTKRGLYPYEAVDVILRSERRKCDNPQEGRQAPAERAMQAGKPLHIL